MVNIANLALIIVKHAVEILYHNALDAKRDITIVQKMVAYNVP